ncbi:MAG: BPSS1780 family membrane protein [Betaproteobacteria bacterium]|nr:BPSS1780 family membrane protein [Betaproteobacteria bacterium]MDH3436325.1 BPSS1780 family membrane protein [Betaproteobacteria bacterium]
MSEPNPNPVPVERVDAAADAAAFVAGGRGLEAARGWAWITEGFQLFKRKAGTWILITIVLGVIFIGLVLIPVVGALASAALYPVFAGGIMLGCHSLAQEGELEFGHLFAGFRSRAGDLVVIGLLSIVAWIIIIIPVILAIGAGAFFASVGGDPEALVAAIGPGVAVAWLLVMGLAVPVYMALWFAPALVVLREMPPIEALKQSFRGCLRNVVPFLVYGVVMMVLGVIAVIPAGLGLLVLMPVIMASVYVAFRDIFIHA